MHEYLDELCGSGFYGEATFYFQNGGIESVRQSSRLSKGDITRKKATRRVIIPLKKPREDKSGTEDLRADNGGEQAGGAAEVED
jgi:hypothetical protein